MREVDEPLFRSSLDALSPLFARTVVASFPFAFRGDDRFPAGERRNHRREGMTIGVDVVTASGRRCWLDPSVPLVTTEERCQRLGKGIAKAAADIIADIRTRDQTAADALGMTLADYRAMKAAERKYSAWAHADDFDPANGPVTIRGGKTHEGYWP